MIKKAILGGGVVTIAYIAIVTGAVAADTAMPLARQTRFVERVEDCSTFCEPRRSRRIPWDFTRGVGLGFGTFEGALPMYPSNSFPNWYGACLTWGHYTASGAAR